MTAALALVFGVGCWCVLDWAYDASLKWRRRWWEKWGFVW